MKSLKYVDLLAEKHNLKNDVAICKLLNWSSGQISQYRSGKRIMDDEACLALALALNVNPMEIIGAACIDRAEKTGQHSLWEVFMQRMAATAASVILGLVAISGFTAPDTAQAQVVQKGPFPP